jgi:hypothetical protein
MPLLHVTAGQVDIELGRALGRMSQDLLQDGGGARSSITRQGSLRTR